MAKFIRGSILVLMSLSVTAAAVIVAVASI